jgi:hypothetical protein
MKPQWIARHGDVPVFSIKKLPEGEMKQCNELTVALGEVTGHHHTLYGPMKTIQKDGVHFVSLETETPMKHQEHKEIPISKGFRMFGRKVERDPFLDTISKVQD